MLLALRRRLGRWLIERVVPAVFPRINPLLRWLLRSPLHPLASWYVVLLRFEGRRTGRTYEVPLAYHRAEDGVLESVTGANGRWWRNLKHGGEIKVLLQGHEQVATVAVVLEDEEAIVRSLRSRDLCRRFLMPVTRGQTVLLRLSVVPTEQ